MLVSRHGGAPAWSPDGKRLAIANLPPPDLTYNGNPERNTDEPPPLFAGSDAFRLWLVDAPLPVDSGEREIVTPAPRDNQLLAAYDRVWETLRRLYYSTGPSASSWQELRAKYRPQAQAAKDESALESAIDAMVAEQPLIKPLVVSDRAVVVSGHPLASRAGALVLEKGGNIVDAAIAVSFALGVVEPDASGIGGDGMAVLYLKGMTEPVAIDYKDQVPIRATRDNPLLTASTGDGAIAANIPGVVAGLDLLYRSYGSKRIPWSELVAPAVEYAESGYELDAALPTTIAEGRKFFEKYRSSARIYLPDGRVPESRRSLRQQGLRRDAADDCQRRRRQLLSRLDRPAHRRRHGEKRRPHHRRRSGAVPRHRAPPARRPLSRSPDLLVAAAGLDRCDAHRDAADPPELPAKARYVVCERRRLPALRDRVLARARSGRAYRRPRALGRQPRAAPRPVARGHAFQAHRHEEDLPRPHRPTADTPAERIGRGTTAFAVVDAEGNMIAVTQTLSTWGGAFYVSDGLGFLYNNHLRLGGGAPGRFLPLARSSSTSVPTLVFKASGSSPALGTPRLAVGAAGNNWIPASVYDIILNVIDGGMDAQRAIEAPRFLISRDPADPAGSRIQLEDRIPRSVLEDLTARGHRFQKIGRKGEVRYGYAAVAVVDVDRRQVQGGAEPRRSHAAVAVWAVGEAVGGV